MQESPTTNASAQSNVKPLQLPINQWPQGARPKTTNQHPANFNPSGDQSLQQSSSSSGSTITSGDDKYSDLQASNPSPDHDDFDVEGDSDDDRTLPVSEEKADTSSLSSIEILNMPSDDWRGDDISEHHEGLVYPAMQPLMSSSALSTHAGMWVCVGGVLNMSLDDWGGDDISGHHEGLVYPVMQPLMSSSALSTHAGMWVCVGCVCGVY